MLRALKLRAELAQKRKDAETLKEKLTGFKTRKQELERSLEECESDEDLKLVKESVEALEKEMDEEDAETKLGNIEQEIEGIERELDEIEKASRETKPKDIEQRSEAKEGRNKMTGILGTLDREQRREMMNREDVQTFLTKVREMKGQSRAVSGVELTIPTIMLELLRDNLHKYSKLITKVRLKPVKGKARQNILGVIPEAVWTEMLGKINELSFEINQVEVDGYAVAGYIVIANSYLEDSDENLAAEILEMIAQSIGLALDKAIVYGKGTKMPLGFITRLAQATEPTNYPAIAPEWEDLHTSNLKKFASASLTAEKFFETLITNLGSAKANYSNGEKVWLMNSTTRIAILAKAINFNAAGALAAGMNNAMPIIGGEIIELEFIPDGEILGGYLNLYLLAEREGAKLTSSEHVRFFENQTAYKGVARYDGMPVVANGFVGVNIENKEVTTTTDFAEDKANTTA